MNIQQQSYPIRTLPTGETLHMHTYTCTSTNPGPTIYLQANLHGSEVFGTYMLIDMLEILKDKDFSGTVIIVPCANPIAVNTAGYNGINGRWNPENGTNWNRIFPFQKTFTSKQSCKEFYKKELQQDGLSIEQKLAYTLHMISAPADYVIDIHTTGSACHPHLFTHKQAHTTFAPLGCSVHIEWDKDHAIGAFDESCVLRFSEEKVQACTWEVYHHNGIDSKTKTKRIQQLINCLEYIWQAENYKPKEQPVVTHISQTAHLAAPIAGYYHFTKELGKEIKKGEAYAEVYQPWAGNKKNVIAQTNITLLGTYGKRAVAEGEQIAWIAKT